MIIIYNMDIKMYEPGMAVGSFPSEISFAVSYTQTELWSNVGKSIKPEICVEAALAALNMKYRKCCSRVVFSEGYNKRHSL